MFDGDCSTFDIGAEVKETAGKMLGAGTELWIGGHFNASRVVFEGATSDFWLSEWNGNAAITQFLE